MIVPGPHQPPPYSPPTRPRLTRLAVLLLLVLAGGALLRLVALDRWSLWTDEQYSLDLAREYRLGPTQVPPDQHPPLYYLVMRQLITVSDAEAWLRLPSALGGIVALLFIWKSGAAWQDRRLALLATALVAFSPLLIWYAREARMYGLAIAAWAISIYHYIQSFRRRTWIDAAGLAAANLVGLYLTYSSLALWFGQMALFPLFWFTHERRREQLLRWVLAQLLTAAGFAVWWPYLQQQMSRGSVFTWRLPFVDLSGTLAETFQRGLLLAAIAVLAMAFASLFIASRQRWRQSLQRLVPIVAWLLVCAYLIVLIIGVVPRGLSIRRQLLVFLLPLILAAAWGLRRISLQRLETAIITLSILLAIYTVASPPYEDWRGALTFVAREREPNDQLFVYPWWRSASVDYYYPGGISAANLAPVRDLLPGETPFPTGSDVWVVLDTHPTVAADVDRIWTRLEKMGTLELRHQFPRYIEVRLYHIRSSPDTS